MTLPHEEESLPGNTGTAPASRRDGVVERDAGARRNEALGTRSAASLAGMLARTEISARDLVTDFAAQYDRLNPAINAIVAFDIDGAFLAAAQSDARRASGHAIGPLDGIPVTIKDNLFLKGYAASWGSKLFESHRPDNDDIAMSRLREAGANLLAKTNTPEFALAAHTDNLVYGPTRNPWRLDLTPGGSSGGAVAALAAGIGPLAVGTDAGGSIRRPASYAGVAGFRPSTGRIPRVFGFPALAADFQVVAPAARTIDDTYTLFRTMAGPDIRDRSSFAFHDYPLPPQLDGHRLKRLRICHVGDVEGSPVDREVREQVAAAARILEGLGHHVESGRAPFDLAQIENIWSTLTAVSLARLLASRDDAADLMQPSSLETAKRGAGIGAQEYAAALDAVQHVRRELDLFFSRFDILLTPTSASLPWAIGKAYPELIDGIKAGPRRAAVFATFVNVAGIPAISLPVGMGASQLPIGMQLAGGFGHDLSVLSLAKEFESASPWTLLAPAPT